MRLQGKFDVDGIEKVKVENLFLFDNGNKSQCPRFDGLYVGSREIVSRESELCIRLMYRHSESGLSG